MAEHECCIYVDVPAPIVKKPRLLKHAGVDQGTRVGRGFSLGELKAVGLSEKLAKELNIPVDRRRRSVRQENVEALKRFLESVKELLEAKKAKPARLAPTQISEVRTSS